MSDVRRETLAAFKALCAALDPIPDDAAHVHERLINVMSAAGYRVFHEYPVQLDDGRWGRIDIVAQAQNGRWLAIEIDARKPRLRSIRKLATANWIRVSCLRGVSAGPKHPDLDAIILLPVKTASSDEKWRKPSVAVAGGRARGAAQ